MHVKVKDIDSSYAIYEETTRNEIQGFLCHYIICKNK